MTYSNLITLARVSPRSDSELVHMTQGAAADVADLATALFHERTGQHADGCDVCDLPSVEALAAETLGRAGLEVAREAEADARINYYTAFHVGSPAQIERARDAYNVASELVVAAEAVQS